MFNPQYKINLKIIKNLGDIERLYGKLEGMKIPFNLRLDLERKNLVQSSFSSNSIEGNPLSQVEVTNLILGDRVPANRDEKEVQNYFDILKSFDQQIQKDLSLDFVLETHKTLLTGVNDQIAGEIRDSEVFIGYKDVQNEKLVIKHEPPFHKRRDIQISLSELILWVNESEELAILRAGIYHHQFVYLHPFADGNGRVCRLTTAFLLLKNDYLINKYFVLDDYYDVDRDQYSDKLHSADKGNKTEWLEYFTDGVKYSLQSALSKFEKELSRTTIELRPTKRESEVLELLQQYKELKTSDVSEDLGVSRQQAFNLLRHLVEKGYAKSCGQGKNSYYKLSE